MPFTFSHPAIILPLRYSHFFSLTGLIVGSMSPDFEYFIRMHIIGKYGHTLGGVFYLDLPLGLLFAFVFHQLIRNSLIDNLPLFLKSRVYSYKTFNWISYCKEHSIIVLFSVILGAFTHLFWDAFTHYDGFFVVRATLLQKDIYHIPVFKILQYLSTLLGALFITYVILKLPEDKKIKSEISKKYWILESVFVLMITIFRFLWEPEKFTFGNLLVTVIFSAFLGLLILGYFYKKIPMNTVR